MHVIATAGHVDHGKSTLVHALTGTDPDRLDEEHRRGLTIELGFCWTALPGAGDVAFVDVPGHERFISTMLAGVGPVPAVMFVVAADDGWMPQAAEHLAALAAFGVRQGILVVTRSDLADPGPALDLARAEIAKTALAGIPAVSVSARTGAGLDALRSALVHLVDRLPVPRDDADVRMWIDRSFHVRGSGTVVTGTLVAGTLRVGDALVLDDAPVRVRSLQSLGRPVDEVSGLARVAVNIGGRVPETLRRGSHLVTPGRWVATSSVDVRLSSPTPLPERPILHIGAAAVSVRARPLDRNLVRLRLDCALPLRIGDRALLRDPGRRTVWGTTVLAPDPPPLRRRGAAAARARLLDSLDGTLHCEVAVRGVVRADQLKRLGVEAGPAPADVVAVDGWLVTREHARELSLQIVDVVRARASELQPGVPVTVVADVLRLAAPVVSALAAAPVRQAAGRLFIESDPQLPAKLVDVWSQVREHLEQSPFEAPDAARLAELRLDRASLAALARAGLALRLDDQVVLLPGADIVATERLARLSQPFTLSEARQMLGTSRRVAVPLLEHLDRQRLTVRHPDSRRSVRDGGLVNASDE